MSSVSSPARVLPQGPIQSNDIVMITTICSGEVYVYTLNPSSGQSEFQAICSVNQTYIRRFRVFVGTGNLLTFITASPDIAPNQSLTYDLTTGDVLVSTGTIGTLALPVFANQNSYTSLEQPASTLASILFSPAGFNTNGTTLPLNFDSEGVLPGCSYPRIALVPTTYYTRSGVNGTTGNFVAITDPFTALRLFACSHGITPNCGGGCSNLPSVAFTTLALGQQARTSFDYCTTGTYCSNGCYSACQTPGQVCRRSGTNNLFQCQTTSTPTPTPTPCPYPSNSNVTVTTTPQSMDITLHHNVNATVSNPPPNPPQPTSYTWLIIGVIIFIILIALMAYWLWPASTPTTISDQHVHTQSYSQLPVGGIY